MKALLTIAHILVICSIASAQLPMSECPFPCTPKNFWEYTENTRFYFPHTKALLEKNPIYTGFSELKSCSSDTVLLPVVYYKYLAGNTLEIINIDTPKVNNSYFGGNHMIHRLVLKDQNNGKCFSYSVILDRTKFSNIKETQDLNDHLFIEGAINLNELEEAQTELQNKRYYTLFPVRGKRYEPITITKVVAGTWETPLRIHYKTDQIADTTIDVNVCGTNVTGNYIKPFHFTAFFACESKQGETPGPLWDIIRVQKVNLLNLRTELNNIKGLTLDKVQLFLSKPKSIKETLTEKVSYIEYTYPQYKLYFEQENNTLRLVKVESTS